MAAAAAIDRFTLFEDCYMINAIQSTGTALTTWASIAASAGGMVLFNRCASVGNTILSSSGEAYVFGQLAATTAYLAQAL